MPSRVLRRERDKDLLAVERVQARKSKKFSVFPGERGCSLWSNVEAPVKVLSVSRGERM